MSFVDGLVAPWLLRFCPDGWSRFFVVRSRFLVGSEGQYESKAIARSTPPRTHPFLILKPAPGCSSPQKNGVFTSAQDLAAIPSEGSRSQPSQASALDLDPALIQKSPVLQRWLREIPDVAAEIANDPSFRTRLRSIYTQANYGSGLQIGVEEVRLARTRFTVSADYRSVQRPAWGTDLRYYVRPLGSYVNVAPVVGYRSVKVNDESVQGVNLGVRLLVVLSRTGGADLSVTQTWVAPGSDREVGLSTVSLGYALTRQLRLSTDFQRQNSRVGRDDRVGIGLEWML